ncbi:Uncharacterised protein [Escherichia coli]|nr:Uncharacterised protein [Escherichia coli]
MPVQGTVTYHPHTSMAVDAMELFMLRSLKKSLHIQLLRLRIFRLSKLNNYRLSYC